MGKGTPDHTRYVLVYLPSREHKEKWKEAAEKRNMKVSPFVIECVEKIVSGKNLGEAERTLLKKARDLEKENRELRKENEWLRVLADKLEAELKYYRTKPFLERDFSGIRSYDKALIELLRKRKFVSSDEILPALDIDSNDPKLVKAVMKQLERLKAYGLVEETVSGWKWLG